MLTYKGWFTSSEDLKANWVDTLNYRKRHNGNIIFYRLYISDTKKEAEELNDYYIDQKIFANNSEACLYVTSDTYIAIELDFTELLDLWLAEANFTEPKYALLEIDFDSNINNIGKGKIDKLETEGTMPLYAKKPDPVNSLVDNMPSPELVKYRSAALDDMVKAKLQGRSVNTTQRDRYLRGESHVEDGDQTIGRINHENISEDDPKYKEMFTRALKNS